ncbi:hypothetical protein CHUAL_001842 [Chamberlinius hualienensis]
MAGRVTAFSFIIVILIHFVHFNDASWVFTDPNTTATATTTTANPTTTTTTNVTSNLATTENYAVVNSTESLENSTLTFHALFASDTRCSKPMVFDMSRNRCIKPYSIDGFPIWRRRRSFRQSN